MFKRLFDRVDTFHFAVSLVKSIIRILAGLALITGQLATAGVLFITAEVLGIIEEL